MNLGTMQGPAKLADAAIPLGRMAPPAEVAAAASFPAGDGANDLAATTIFWDGGIVQGSVGL
jgi:glucose 1-dehydrogenase